MNYSESVCPLIFSWFSDWSSWKTGAVRQTPKKLLCFWNKFAKCCSVYIHQLFGLHYGFCNQPYSRVILKHSVWIYLPVQPLRQWPKSLWNTSSQLGFWRGRRVLSIDVTFALYYVSAVGKEQSRGVLPNTPNQVYLWSCPAPWSFAAYKSVYVRTSTQIVTWSVKRLIYPCYCTYVVTIVGQTLELQ